MTKIRQTIEVVSVYYFSLLHVNPLFFTVLQFKNQNT